MVVLADATRIGGEGESWKGKKHISFIHRLYHVLPRKLKETTSRSAKTNERVQDK